MSHFRKRVSIAMSGALLLVGLQLNAPICQAQAAPAVVAPAVGSPAEAMQMRARRLAMDEQLKKCAQPIDIQVSSATLKQLVKQVQLATPDASIELRLNSKDKALQRQLDDGKIKLEETKLPQFSFALERKPLGDVLQSAATLAGYNFYILPDELLISQPKELAPAERERSASWNLFARQSQSRTLAKPLTSEQRQVIQTNNENLLVVGRELLSLARQKGATEGPFTLRFGDFSPELQKRIQTSADYLSRSSKYPEIKVPDDASVDLTKFDPTDVRFTLTIKARDITTDLNRTYGFRTDISSGAATSGPTYRVPAFPID